MTSTSGQAPQAGHSSHKMIFSERPRRSPEVRWPSAYQDVGKTATSSPLAVHPVDPGQLFLVIQADQMELQADPNERERPPFVTPSRELAFAAAIACQIRSMEFRDGGEPLGELRQIAYDSYRPFRYADNVEPSSSSIEGRYMAIQQVIAENACLSDQSTYCGTEYVVIPVNAGQVSVCKAVELPYFSPKNFLDNAVFALYL